MSNTAKTTEAGTEERKAPGTRIDKKLPPLTVPIAIKRGVNQLFMQVHAGEAEAVLDDGREVKAMIGTTAGLGGTGMVVQIRVKGGDSVGYYLDVQTILQALVGDAVKIIDTPVAERGYLPDEAVIG